MTLPKSEKGPARQWRIVVACLVLSFVAAPAAVRIAGELPFPWRFRSVHAESVSIGGGPGQGSIILTAERPIGDAPMLIVKGEGSQSGVTLTGFPRGGGDITWDAGSGKGKLVISYLPSGRPAIRLLDPETGKVGWSVTLDDNGQPVIEPR
ncbi:MAG: hypothetical protein IBJ11_11940 [Phycisphaerales bacterium]|nr:hypothetical protein [Phycisphaerales bacterium]